MVAVTDEVARSAGSKRICAVQRRKVRRRRRLADQRGGHIRLVASRQQLHQEEHGEAEKNRQRQKQDEPEPLGPIPGRLFL